MIASILGMAAAIAWLAAGLGVLGVVALFILPPLYENWRLHKYMVDSYADIMDAAAEALEKAEGRPLSVVFNIEEGDEDGEGLRRED